MKIIFPAKLTKFDQAKNSRNSNFEMTGRLRNAVFTLNNYNEDDEQRLVSSDRISYVIYGRELAPRTGTKHLQGYVEFAKQVSFAQAKEALGSTAHIERRRGTQEEAITYCKKDGDIVERGAPRAQGARADLDGVRETALDGGMREVVRTGNQQSHRVAEKFLEYWEELRSWKMYVVWTYGAPGIGKSSTALADALTVYPRHDIYIKSTGGKWWPGYDGHPAVILDDLRPDWFPFTYLLGLLDRYEFRVEPKYAHRQFRAHHVWINTVRSPKEWNLDGEDMQQLLRRISLIIHMI